MKKRKGLLITVAVIFIIFAAMGTAMFVQAGKDMKDIVLHEVDMNAVSDGEYEGAAETTLVKVKVLVTVKEHKILNIEILEHQNGKGEKAEQITQMMITDNTYDVDAVSGATMSSEVIKSAVSDALLKGVGK